MRPSFHSLRFAIALACASLFPLTAAAAPSPTGMIGKVVKSGGAASRNFDQKSEPLKPGDFVYAGDTIESGNGEMLLLAADGTVRAALKLKPATRVKLEPATEGGPGLRVELLRGGILSDVHNPKKSPNAYEIRTKTATMGVRGTVFYAHEMAGRLFLCTCAGEVGIKTADSGSEERIKSTHHDRPITLSAKSTGPLAERLKSAPMGEDHADSDAAELEKALEGFKGIPGA